MTRFIFGDDSRERLSRATYESPSGDDIVLLDTKLVT